MRLANLFSLVIFFLSSTLGGCSCERRTEAESRRPSAKAQTVALRGKNVVDGMSDYRKDDRDADGDGIDDSTELSLAKSYFPYFSVASDDGCPLHGVLFRLTPHPADRTKIAIWYIVLFEHDCGIRSLGGLGSHLGDDEVFGEIVDPSRPAPEGILALRAVSHQNTTCERVTSCGSLGNCRPCMTAQKNGQPYPVVFSSRDKHGGYASESACKRWLCERGGCTLSPAPDAPMFVNAGEPGRPLTRDLTAAGLITLGNGWTEPSLLNFDPWGGHDFGGAGNVTDDLIDDSFLIMPSGC